jgi:hypothetical protein
MDQAKVHKLTPFENQDCTSILNFISIATVVLFRELVFLEDPPYSHGLIIARRELEEA